MVRTGDKRATQRFAAGGYFMFLDGDMVIGGAMGMSAFFCLIVTTIYVYQPKAQKCVGRPSRTAIVRSSPQCVPQDGQDDVQS